MKVQIPEQLKSDVPQTTFGKILAATPVIMAVVATMLAGLASSEMTRAQYDRALAAQQQSKAGDQWSFFQAKRLRGAIQQNSFELLETMGEIHPLTLASLRGAAEQSPVQPPEAAKLKTDFLTLLDSADGKQAVGFLNQRVLPPLPAPTPVSAKLQTAMTAVEASKPDPEVIELLAPVSNQELEDALCAARDHVQAFDNATKPINRAIDNLDALLARRGELQPGPANVSLARDFTAARLRFAALRYEAEARLNQSIANLYELQVRKSNVSAERHHARSQRFFFGMLAAQAGVIISTFAMAARQRNLLWTLAAAAGLAAIALAIYVYFCV